MTKYDSIGKPIFQLIGLSIFLGFLIIVLNSFFASNACAQGLPTTEENVADHELRITELETIAADHEARISKLEEVKEILFIVKTFTDMNGKNSSLYLILLSTGANVTVVGDQKTNNFLTLALANNSDLIVVSDDISEANMNIADVRVPSGKTENQILKETTTPVMIAAHTIFSELGIGPEFMRVSDFDIVIADAIASGIPNGQRVGGSYAVTKVSTQASVIAFDDSLINVFAILWIYEPGDVTFDGFTVPGFRAGFPYHGNSPSSHVLVIARKMAMFLLAQP